LKQANFYRVSDLLSDNEKKMINIIDRNNKDLVENIYDIDDVNFDISHAAIKLLIKNTFFSTKFKNTMLNYNNKKLLNKTLSTRPPCRFEIIKKKFNIEDYFNTLNNFNFSNTTLDLLKNESIFNINSNLDNNNNNNNNTENNIKINYILDIAHNYDAIIALIKKINKNFDLKKTKIRLVLAMSADKDVDKCLLPILKFVDFCDCNIICTEV
jgi:folylpolyglutamate synthase/dihydropteroate synthase